MKLATSRVFALASFALAACSSATSSGGGSGTPQPTGTSGVDARVGLRPGTMDAAGTRVATPAAEAAWNMRLISLTPPPAKFMGSTNSDLAFVGNYAIQGNYNGWQVWDISNPTKVTLKKDYYCPASQSDVSVYRNLLVVSSESNSGRLDCTSAGAPGPVNHDRIRGIRMFDISDITNPRYLGNVQTCRGSHTHTLLADPRDPANVYVYISGSGGVRPSEEMPGCSNKLPGEDPNSSHFRIEVIKIPLADPSKAAIVASPRIFNDLAAPATHGLSAADISEINAAKARGAFIAQIGGSDFVLPDGFIAAQLDSVVKARKGTGAPTKADSAAFRAYMPGFIKMLTGGGGPASAPTGPDQCHDITVYPEIGLAGGACGGYGLLLDIKDPAHPVRIGAVADSNFSYWHSATFNNDGTKLLFSDEWGGGGAPKCRAGDKYEWGADAIFELVNGKMVFKSYYKMPAVQTSNENCVAHNGSLIPIPGRDVMIQAWYQGGVSVFDWTDAAHPKEIAWFDRGPSAPDHMGPGGSWSVYWYNGVMVSSEILRGLDIFELSPSAFISQNEIDAAKTAHADYLNTQGQRKYSWPASFSLARAYIDQLARNDGLSSSRVQSTRTALVRAEAVRGAQRRDALTQLATQLNNDPSGVSDRAKMQKLAAAVRELADATNN